jgi:hypothetical protein
MKARIFTMAFSRVYLLLEEYTRTKTSFIHKIVDRARKDKGPPLQSVWENENGDMEQ